MASLLRNIRRTLLNSAATRKYLFYALGEFILIVSGILVAMEINDWNESRKEEQFAGQYLRDIYNDLESSVVQLEEVAQQLRKESLAAEYILETMDTPETEIPDSLRIYEAFTEVGANRIGITGNRVYQELSRSGKLGVVHDAKLLTRLNDFNFEYEKVASGYNQQAVQMKLDLQKFWSAETRLAEWKSERKTGLNHTNQIKRLLISKSFYQLLMQNLITADMTKIKVAGLRDHAGSVLRYMADAYPDLTSNPQ